MAKLTPSEAREKHARRLKASLEDMARGVNAVTEAPGRKAAAKQEKMLANLTASVRSGKWASKVSAVPLDEWKKQMVEKGLPRVSAGIDGAAAKVESFFGQLLPYQDSLKSKLTGMPDLTLEDNISRMTTWIRGMAGFKPK